MAFSVVSGSTSLAVARPPTVNRPRVAGDRMLLSCVGLDAAGQCQITGMAGDDPAGWVLGMIQLQWIMTDWRYYRGQTNTDGDCFVQCARPPARPMQACRDTQRPHAIFVDINLARNRTIATAGAAFPITMTAAFTDAPNGSIPLTLINPATRRINYLREQQLEMHLCTVLTLRDPEPRRARDGGTYTHLKHFTWFVHWQARYRPTNFANHLADPWTIELIGGPTANKGDWSRRVFEGGPTDPQFTRIITARRAPNCNVVANRAANAPIVRPSPVWTNHDVRL